MHDLIDRLYRTKMLLSSIILAVAGTLLIVIDNQINAHPSLAWLSPFPWSELGGILFGAGLLSIWLDHFFQREQDAADDLRLRQLLNDQAPAMRDAVLEAFAANHDDLVRVATPELLDQIIGNSLALRLHDEQFAHEIYGDIRDQAVNATERWYDAALSIDLSPLPMGSGTPSRSTAGSATSNHFTVTMRWEYKVVPQHPQRRFVCTSDRTEYNELANQRGDTSAWYLKPSVGVDASQQDAFELVQFSVDGVPRPIRRSVRKNSQTYTVSVGPDAIKAAEPVTIAYTYRAITSQAGHLLFFDIEQPTRDLKVEFDYSDCGIASVSTLDLIPAIRPTRIERTPASLPATSIRLDLDGWIFPRSGIAFIWTLESEDRHAAAALEPK